MAPDLNGVLSTSNNAQTINTTSSSIQASPHHSRRTSSVMGPPPVPQNSSLPNSPRPPTGTMDNTSYTNSSGPIRHPRPLTAAELHLELEKEQESIVNRLTRELSALRAQTASVASTTSSTSDLFTTPSEPYLYGYNAPNIIPTTARRHRSSSNLSSRSARSTRDTLSNTAAGATSVSGVAAPRDRDNRDRDHASHSQSHQTSSRPSMDIPRPEISRQNSTSASVTGGAQANASIHRTPSAAGPMNATSPHWPSHTTHGHSHPRHSLSSSIPATPNLTSSVSAGSETYARSPSGSISAAQAQARYEEAALHRAELETVKKENEALRMKIKELERSLAERAAEKNTPGRVNAARGESGVSVGS